MRKRSRPKRKAKESRAAPGTPFCDGKQDGIPETGSHGDSLATQLRRIAVQAATHHGGLESVMTDAPLKGSFVPVWIPDLDGFPITGFCGQEGLILVEATPLQSLQRHILEILSDSMPRKKTAMVRILAQQEQPESGMPLAVAVGRALQELRKAAKITVTGQFWKLVRSSEEKPPLGSVAKLG